MTPLDLAIFVPLIPALAAALCGLCAIAPRYAKLAPVICNTAVFSSFFITVAIYAAMAGNGWQPMDVPFFEWIAVSGVSDGAGADAGAIAESSGLLTNWGYYLDGLSLVMMLVVTGIGSLITVYAAGYMEHDAGVARFFAGVSLFIFAMTTVAMADNLVLIFLGWEGVGLASYLLIGHYFTKPSAVAAAKKAFIVNRIGDAGFLLGIFCCYGAFGSASYQAILPAAEALVGWIDPATLADNALALAAYERAGHTLAAGHGWLLTLAPFGLLLGAIGKSAQFPLFVWLPDAMEGPTPVSALIHAATMVTSGVYLVARTMPLFEYSPYALPTVATIGAFTALLGASVAMAQYDLKRIFAYSTVSQLGYMFMAVGAGSATAGIFHLMTHAFFKALLFLTAGNVMHALAGNLDIRTFSGLGRRLPMTQWLMLAGCLALAGFPLTSGFFSKDLILAETFHKGDVTAGGDLGIAWLYLMLGFVGVVTAAMTAYYAFRAWFRTFRGVEHWTMGDEHHGPGDNAQDDPTNDHHTPHAPHEMPWWPMNAPLLVLMVGALLAGFLGVGTGDGGFAHGWIGNQLHHSTAYPPPQITQVGHAGQAGHAAAEGHHATLLGLDVHTAVVILSITAALLGIAAAWVLHGRPAPAAPEHRQSPPPARGPLAQAWYFDAIYHAAFALPLRILAYAGLVADLVVQGLVMLVGSVPAALGTLVQPIQKHGRLAGYALGAAFGMGLILIYVVVTATQLTTTN